MNSPDQFRLFIAFSVPDPVKDAVKQAQLELARLLPAPAARWTPRDQLHLTVRFLGSVAVSQAEAILEQMRETCLAFAPLQLNATGLGFFPIARSPRVLWTGITDLENQLPLLWAVVQRATQPFTIESDEKAFHAHVTLARLNRIPRAALERLMLEAGRNAKRVFGQWVADRLELVRSELLAGGAHHSVLGAVPLRGSLSK